MTAGLFFPIRCFLISIHVKMKMTVAHKAIVLLCTAGRTFSVLIVRVSSNDSRKRCLIKQIVWIFFFYVGFGGAFAVVFQ